MMKHILLLALFGLSLWTLVAQSNQYLHFDRQDDYVRLDGGSQYISNINQFTMAGWFYTDELAYGQGMIGFRGGSQGFYLIQLSNGTLESRLITNTGFYEYAPNFAILPEIWQHVAWVYTGDSVKLYIDGNLHGGRTASGQITDANIPFTIGRSILTNLNFYFGGRADEVTVWSKALNPSEIQDMMANELTGNEANLELYYKMNQGAPGGDNTAISKLISETGSGDRDGDLINFAMDGPESNFAGMLEVGFQAISFDEVPNKLNTTAPFDLTATASSGLPVSFSLISGPATLNGNVITLDGTAGEVVVMASQPGDTVYSPAADVIQSFHVVDPNVTVPHIDLRNPLQGDVYVPFVDYIQLAAIADIDFPELLSVGSVQFEIDGQVIPAKDWGNGHYTAWWMPSQGHDTYSLTVRAFNNFGTSGSHATSVNIMAAAPNETATAFSDIHLSSTTFTEEIDAELPSFLGSYSSITANLTVSCPTGGCGPWDRVAKVEIKTHEGNWVEMIRYITPYGVPCGSSLDVTDFMAALQGKITFRVTCETFDNGFEYDLTLDYQQGVPEYRYGIIQPFWKKTYDFGNPSNLNPVETMVVNFPENTLATTFKLVSSGHGWGDNNTSNAAEFFNTTHHIWVDGAQTFDQHNWMICNPNPDGCQPQNGTWFHNRAGFCPGAISNWFDYDMTPYIANGSASLDYLFDQNYVDLCHANNPNCVSGVTCPNCNDGFNPHLIVASSMHHFSDVPLDTAGTTAIEDLLPAFDFRLYPNPSTGMVEINLTESLPNAYIQILNPMGQEVKFVNGIVFMDQKYNLDLSDLAQGLYMVVLGNQDGSRSKRLQISR